MKVRPSVVCVAEKSASFSSCGRRPPGSSNNSARRNDGCRPFHLRKCKSSVFSISHNRQLSVCQYGPYFMMNGFSLAPTPFCLNDGLNLSAEKKRVSRKPSSHSNMEKEHVLDDRKLNTALSELTVGLR